MDCEGDVLDQRLVVWVLVVWVHGNERTTRPISEQAPPFDPDRASPPLTAVRRPRGRTSPGSQRPPTVPIHLHRHRVRSECAAPTPFFHPITHTQHASSPHAAHRRSCDESSEEGICFPLQLPYDLAAGDGRPNKKQYQRAGKDQTRSPLLACFGLVCLTPVRPPQNCFLFSPAASCWLSSSATSVGYHNYARARSPSVRATYL